MDVELRLEFIKISENRGKMSEIDKQNSTKVVHVYRAYKHTQKLQMALNNIYGSRSTGYPICLTKDSLCQPELKNNIIKG